MHNLAFQGYHFAMAWKDIDSAPRDGTPIQVQDADAPGIIYWVKYWTKKNLKKEGWGNNWNPGWYEYYPGAQWEDGEDLVDPSIWRDPSDD